MSCYFTLFYCLLDLSCGECNVISLYYMTCSVVCCMFDSIYETIHNMFRCGCYFVVKCFGSV